jgi:hypothetical protein
MSRRNSSGKHKVKHNSREQGDNVSFINARRTAPKSGFNHQWNDSNKQRFNKFTNLKDGQPQTFKKTLNKTE